MYQIKSVLKSDIEAVVEVDNEAYGEKSYPYSYFKQMSELCPDTFLGAYNANELAGYVLALLDNQQTKAIIVAICVLEKYRKKGVGKLLMEGIETAIQPYDLEKLELTVDPENNAKFLYLDYGDNIVEYDANYFGAGQGRERLEKQMTDN